MKTKSKTELKKNESKEIELKEITSRDIPYRCREVQDSWSAKERQYRARRAREFQLILLAITRSVAGGSAARA